jgi:hypothetical protein
MTERAVGIRWTIGSVTAEGFEALRLAVWGARKVFGPDAAYAICVNSLPVAEARRRTGALPAGVKWIAARGGLPDWLRPHVGENMAEGKAWKFDPLHAHPDRWEIAFDNDCILWRMPDSIRGWLEAGDEERCLIAADVAACHGAFSRYAGGEPRNAGIRGLPPRFPLADQLSAILAENPVVMTSELDEQGLQVAAVSRRTPPVVVGVDEVSICSPFPPHLPHVGTSGVHFVGLNDHELPWKWYDRPASEVLREHWERLKPEVYERVGIDPPHRQAGAA